MKCQNFLSFIFLISIADSHYLDNERTTLDSFPTVYDAVGNLTCPNECSDTNPSCLVYLCCNVGNDIPMRCQECSLTCDCDFDCPGIGIDFVTAAKIALLFALIFTVIAVIIMIYRAFLQPRCFPGSTRRRTVHSDTSSLNSVQRYVMQMLEARPPQYDDQPEKPPTYDECINDAFSTPPQYADVSGIGNETSLDTANNSSVFVIDSHFNNRSSVRGPQVNEGFERDEDLVLVNRSTNDNTLPS